jgi:hypothetical protein
MRETHGLKRILRIELLRIVAREEWGTQCSHQNWNQDDGPEEKKTVTEKTLNIRTQLLRSARYFWQLAGTALSHSVSLG